MLKNLFRAGLVLSSKRESVQIANVCVRMKTTEETTEEQLNTPTPKVSEKRGNPFDARESNSLNSSQQGTQLTANEKDRLLKLLQLEVDNANHEGRRVPSLDFFKDHHWEHALTLSSKTARLKYYAYLFVIQVRKAAEKLKKEENAASISERVAKIRQERAENPHIVYGLGNVTMFLRVYDTTINQFYNNRLTRAMQFSPKIVLDCSYDEYMTRKEAENAAKQLMLSFADNRTHDDPFDLHYCNVNLHTTSMKGLHRYIPTMLNPEFPINIHQKCFTKIFPKENLVYLTPNCYTDLEKYNPDDVYIIGALVDTSKSEPLSLAKAKKMGLRMARLPLDRYLEWGSGSGKSLTINQMVSVMLDLKKTGDWDVALKHVPRRKLRDDENYRNPENYRNTLNKRANQLNIPTDGLLKDDETNLSNKNLRSYKDKSQFNLSTWGSKKKESQ